MKQEFVKLKISVLTPSYNSGKFIERAIKSVLKQDYSHWEHIIVDGQSEDCTLEVIRRYDHLNWISESDRGQSDAMNKAFRMSSRDIIVYLNADDEFKENAFSTVINQFQDPNVDFVVGALERISDDGTSKIIHPSTELPRILKYWPCAFPGNPVSYFYRRKVQETIGEFPIHNHYSMDYWFLLRVYHQYRIQKIDEVLGTFHFSRENKSADATRARVSLRKTRNEFILEQRNWQYLSYLVKNKLYEVIARL